LQVGTFTVSVGIRIVEFQVTECEPGEYCSVTPNTETHTDGGPLELKDDNNADIGNNDISQCYRQLGLLRKIIKYGFGGRTCGANITTH
jgi:transitional endoplasmic reticulum ATPase